jgi:hypothetical protein
MAPTVGLRNDLAMLKTAILYGDNVDVVTPPAPEWRFWLDFDNPNSVGLEFKLRVLELLLSSVPDLDIASKWPPGTVERVGTASREYLARFRGSVKSEASGLPEDVANSFRRQLDSAWPYLATNAGAAFVPGLWTIRKLVEGDRVSVASLFDQDVIPSGDL